VTRTILLALGLLAAGAASAAETPACPALGLRLDDEVAKSARLREPANEQAVRDLRTLRDAAVVLDAYGYGPECARVGAILRDLLDNPRKAISQGGDTDEEKAEAVEEARAPKPAKK
jgi:hypothetical protein